MKFKDVQEYYLFVDSVRDRLRNENLLKEGDLLDFLIHKGVWTSASELFDEIEELFQEIRNSKWNDLSEDLQTDINECSSYMKEVYEKR